MLKTITLVLALAASGLAATAVSANAAPNFISHANSQASADTACSVSHASYCN